MKTDKGFSIIDGTIILHIEAVKTRGVMPQACQKFANKREKARKADKRQKQKGWD